MSRFIYGLVDPLEPKHVRYVGMATRDERPFDHANEARKTTKSSYKLNWIRKVQAEGREPEFITLEQLSDSCLPAFLGFVESCYIASLRAIGHRLTNKTDGGEGTLGLRWSDEAKAGMSVVATQRSADPEWRAGVSARAKKRYEDPEFCQEFSEAMSASYTPELRQRRSDDAKGNQNFLGKTHSTETRAAIGSAVSQRSSEEQATNARKGWVVRRANGNGVSKRTPEERSATAHKVWATRRANQEAKAQCPS